MSESTGRRHNTPLKVLILASFVIAIPLFVVAQGGRGGAPAGGTPAGGGAPAAGAVAAQAAPQRGAGPAAAGARAAAPVDLTGYWVSIVTEDWIERMSPDSPPSGVRGGRGGPGGAPQAGAVPAPPGGERCRVYGAGGGMRVPGRLNINWQDDNTLKVDMDAGTQTRLFHFDTAAAPAGTPKSLQGYSVASWEGGRGGGGGAGGGGGGGRGGAPAPAAARWGSLKVVTTNLSGGYLLSSRNSYSENATVTEYFTRHSDFGQEYFTVTVLVDDPTPPAGAGGGRGGRGGPYSMTSSTFKKEPNGSKFAPSGCDIVR